MAITETVPPVVESPTSRYSVVEGHGNRNCEEYAKALNDSRTIEVFPSCDLKVNLLPDVREPMWETQPIGPNLRLIHQIELILGPTRLDMTPSDDFNLWQTQFRRRIEERHQSPRLRRAQIVLTGDRVARTVLTYQPDVHACEQEVAKAIKGQPFDSWLARSNFFILDNTNGRIFGGQYWGTFMRGDMLIRDGAAFYANAYFGSDMADVAGHIYLEELYDAPPNTVSRQNGGYMNRRTCHVRFDYPFRRN